MIRPGLPGVVPAQRLPSLSESAGAHPAAKQAGGPYTVPPNRIDVGGRDTTKDSASADGKMAMKSQYLKT